MLALCQHNTLAYYAFYYAGIFDAGLHRDTNKTKYMVHLQRNKAANYKKKLLKHMFKTASSWLRQDR